MDTQTRDAFEPPVINPWRQPPSRDQVRYAADLCNSELPSPQETIDGFAVMSRYEMSNLIKSLTIMRAKRLRNAPRNRQWRLAPMGRRR